MSSIITHKIVKTLSGAIYELRLKDDGWEMYRIGATNREEIIAITGRWVRLNRAPQGMAVGRSMILYPAGHGLQGFHTSQVQSVEDHA